MSKMINFNNTGKSTMPPMPVLRKQGFVGDNGGESTPFVWHGKLLRSEMIWGSEELSNVYASLHDHGRIVDHETGEVLVHSFMEGRRFITVFCDAGKLYAFGTVDNVVYCEVSEDLKRWKSFSTIEFPDCFTLFNTAVCRAEDKYYIAVEFSHAPGKENPYLGIPFTIAFGASSDMKTWSLFPFEDVFGQDRYSACPTLHYANGWFYMISLEALPFYRFAPYIFRTKDFKTWEVGTPNPVMIVSEEDRHPKNGLSFSAEYLEKTPKGFCSNLSDVELCEFEGVTHILYVSGNQCSFGGAICEAIFDGAESEFLESYFDNE